MNYFFILRHFCFTNQIEHCDLVQKQSCEIKLEVKIELTIQNRVHMGGNYERSELDIAPEQTRSRLSGCKK